MTESLYDQLSQSFPLENVSPFGEVLVIPTKAFREEWRDQLKAERVKIYSQSFNGQSCFFLRKNNQNKNEACQVEVSQLNFSKIPSKRIEWTEEKIQMIVSLRNQGYGFRKIAQQFNQRFGYSVTHSAIAQKLKSLNVQVQNRKTKPKLNSNTEEVKPASSLKKDEVEEFFSAVRILYPDHKNACIILLKKIIEELTE